MSPASGRVLIADDEPYVRELLRDFLLRADYEVATAATGAEALQALRTIQPDVILIDMLMPGLSGTDVINAVRRAGLTVPVILMSGHEVAMPEGVFGVLKKPFDLRRLAELVAAAVGHG